MALTVGESLDVNVLIDYLFGLRYPSGTPVPEEDAVNAAARLADRAGKTLMAGLDGADVRRLWKADPPRPADRRKARAKPKVRGKEV
jgi:hypothetical protein